MQILKLTIFITLMTGFIVASQIKEKRIKKGRVEKKEKIVN